MGDQQDMVSITVLIAGRPYPLKIKAGDEPSIRKIVKDINDTVNRFQLQYTTKDKQDCLAMVALTFAVDSQKNDAQPTLSTVPSGDHQPELFDRLSRIDAMLDDLLN